MFLLFQLLRVWCFARHGATAIEYALIAGGIAVAIAVSVYLFGDAVFELFDSVQVALSENVAGE